jgi:hypothetical protein
MSTAPLIAPPAEAHVFVDTAVGGLDRRNHLQRIGELMLPTGEPEVYASYLRYTEELAAYVERTGSVKGYRGSAWADRIPFDFDREGDPAGALDDLRRFAQWLHDRWDVPFEAMRCFFSGFKGGSLELPAALFGDFQPGENLPDRLGAIASRLVDGSGVTTLDPSLYQHLRLWRWANSINAKGSKFKIELTASDLLNYSSEDIITRAKSAREVGFPPIDDWLPIPELVELRQCCDAAPRTSRPVTAGVADDDPIPLGRRNIELWRRAGQLRRLGCSEQTILTDLRTRNERCEPPLPEDEVADLARRICRYAPAEAMSRAARHSTPIEVVPFPVDALPEPARALVVTAAEALGCPVDYIAVPLMIFAAATMGRRFRIVLKSDYTQLPTLYGVIVGPPGSVKTPATLLAREAMDTLQREEHERYRAQLERYEAELAEWTAAGKRGESAGPKPEPPVETHFLTTDATMEAVASMLETSEGICLSRDEIVGWVASFDAYRGGKGGDRQAWLSLWSGAPIKVDRKAKPSIYIENPVVCVVGGTQPDSLPLLADEAQRRDGFIERLLWSWPESEPAQWTEREIEPAIKAAVLRLFRGLAQHEGDVKLSSEARRLWIDWYNRIHRQARDEAGIMAGVLAKMPNQIARVALILHAMEDPESAARTALSETTMRNALALADYFVAHALRVMPALTSRDHETGVLAERVMRYLQRAAGWVEKRQIFEALGGHVTAATLDGALHDLLHDSAVEQRKVETGKPGRPAEQWRCTAAGEQNELNEQMSGGPADGN